VPTATIITTNNVNNQHKKQHYKKIICLPLLLSKASLIIIHDHHIYYYGMYTKAHNAVNIATTTNQIETTNHKTRQQDNFKGIIVIQRSIVFEDIYCSKGDKKSNQYNITILPKP